MFLGESAKRLDAKLSLFIGDIDRQNIWDSATRMVDAADTGVRTLMGLGYVQSGKTTSISALCATASDRGYRLVIALLGTTTLLTQQNKSRVEDYLGVDDRNYVWHSIHQIKPRTTSAEINDFLSRGRTVLIPVIKNAQVINKTAAVLEACDLIGIKTLIIDDEADQASLNTKAALQEKSSTYAAIGRLREVAQEKLFVQYTATPYAPILLEDDDPLMPETVEFLKPGKGYVGGREFFYTHAKEVLRIIPETDEQTSKTKISTLPASLVSAIAGFFAGTAHLWIENRENAPISMLVHSSFKNDVQEQYQFLLKNFISGLKNLTDIREAGRFHQLVEEERAKLYRLGITRVDNDDFYQALNYVISELTLWLVNSASDVKTIKWNSSPFHLLIGGNKLDRGFTVEGLTVSYMNRPPSLQIDTLEQRARAFGYRTSLLPYCLFFATSKTVRFLRGIVNTEDDLRISLKDALDSGKSVAAWSREIGLLLPAKAVASRSNVLPLLKNFSPDGTWISLRKIDFEVNSLIENESALNTLGIFAAELSDYGRMQFRTLRVTSFELANLIRNWKYADSTPGWPSEDIANLVSRSPAGEALVILLDNPEFPGQPRIRSWDSDTGFSNLFQGRDNVANNDDALSYKGDRQIQDYLPYPDCDELIVAQIHRISRRNMNDENAFTLAIRIPEHGITRKGTIYER